jgi:hypothetical protein
MLQHIFDRSIKSTKQSIFCTICLILTQHPWLLTYNKWMHTKWEQLNDTLTQGSVVIIFLISATTHVESWLSPQFSSIQGGRGLVPTISGVSSFAGHSWRHSIFVWVFLLVELHMAAIYVYFLPYWFQVFYGCVQTNSVFGV